MPMRSGPHRRLAASISLVPISNRQSEPPAGITMPGGHLPLSGTAAERCERCTKFNTTPPGLPGFRGPPGLWGHTHDRLSTRAYPRANIGTGRYFWLCHRCRDGAGRQSSGAGQWFLAGMPRITRRPKAIIRGSSPSGRHRAGAYPSNAAPSPALHLDDRSAEIRHRSAALQR